jgi:hypothetical protein
MACTGKTFQKVVEYQKKRNYKISFIKAKIAIRSEMTEEELKDENNTLICCSHYALNYPETKEVGQCEDCVKRDGYRYMSDPKHGVIGVKPYWVVKRQKFNAEELDPDFDEDKPKKRGRRKKSDSEVIENFAKKKRGRPKKKK